MKVICGNDTFLHFKFSFPQFLAWISLQSHQTITYVSQFIQLFEALSNFVVLLHFILLEILFPKCQTVNMELQDGEAQENNSF